MLQKASQLLAELPIFLMIAVATHLVKSFAQTMMHSKLGNPNLITHDCRRMTMPTGYVLGDMATKAAYFSVAAAAFIFVAMTLLPGLHL